MNTPIIWLVFYAFCLGPSAANKQYPINAFQAGDTIIWSPKYKIGFDDFKGTPKAEDSTKRIDTSAVSSTGIRYHIIHDHNKMRIQTYAVFFKNQSWMRYKSTDILEHERGHFDITMIFAKKWENLVNGQDIEVKKVKDFFNFLDSSYEKIRLEWKAEQDDFDRQAITRLGEQIGYKWIDDQLNQMSLK